MREFSLGRLTVRIQLGDLSTISVDAVVCPANSHGHMRGGVAQVLRIVGGDSIEEEFLSQAPVGVGSAVVTSAGNLPCRWVIHAPTMRDPVEQSSAAAVRLAIRAALQEALGLGLYSVAFPGMGTGTGEVDLDTAALTMLSEIETISRKIATLRLVVLVARDRHLMHAFEGAADATGWETGKD